MTIPPPLAFALLTAAISPAPPPTGPEHGTMLRLEARAVAPPKTATTADAATTADTIACQGRARVIQASPLSAAEPKPLVWPASLGTGAGDPSAKDSVTPQTWPPSHGPGKNPRPSCWFLTSGAVAHSVHDQCLHEQRHRVPPTRIELAHVEAGELFEVGPSGGWFPKPRLMIFAD